MWQFGPMNEVYNSNECVDGVVENNDDFVD